MQSFDHLLADTLSRLDNLNLHTSAQACRRLADQTDSPFFHIVVFGTFSRGKSTLINSLCGCPVLPRRLVPTTGQVTRVMHGEQDEIRIHYHNGKLETGPIDTIDRFSLAAADGHRDDIAILDVITTSPFLQPGVCFLDTPGTNDANSRTTELAEAAIDQADLVLYLLDARQLLVQGEAEYLIRLQQVRGKPVVPVVNKIDLVETAVDVAELHQRFDREVGRHLEPVLPRACYYISALAALKAILRHEPVDRGPAGDFQALAESLKTLSIDQLHTPVGRRARLMPIQHALQQIRDENRKTLRQLTQAHPKLQATRRKQVSRLQAQLERLHTYMGAGAGELAATLLACLSDFVTQLAHDIAHTPLADLDAYLKQALHEKLHQTVRRMESLMETQLRSLAGRRKLVEPLTVNEILTLEMRQELTDTIATPSMLLQATPINDLESLVGESLRRIARWFVSDADIHGLYEEAVAQWWRTWLPRIVAEFDEQHDRRLQHIHDHLTAALQQLEDAPVSPTTEAHCRALLDRSVINVLNRVNAELRDAGMGGRHAAA